MTALYAGGEINRALIAGNNLAGGLRGLYLQRVDHSEIFNNRIQAATWGITEVNCSNNRFGFNPIETAANPGIETVSATAVVAGYQQGAWAPAIGEAGAGLAAMAGGGANGGFWVRNGRAVTVTANVVTTGFGTIAGGTAIRILNLPFACANGAGAAAGAVFGNFAGGALPVAGMSISVVAVNNATYLLLHKWSAVTGTTALTMAEWAAAGGGSFSLTYFTDAPFLSL